MKFQKCSQTDRTHLPGCETSHQTRVISGTPLTGAAKIKERGVATVNGDLMVKIYSLNKMVESM